MVILAIETSCDDTAVAILENGKVLRGNIVSSQEKLHAPYGGIVPEIASRQHLRNIIPVFNQCLQEAKIKLKDINAIAVTIGPGLVISLLVGLNFAKGLAYGLNIPLISVNHLIGHINSAYIENTEIELPFLALVASGGHTNIFYSEDNYNFICLSKTRDDAIGEAYDKIAKFLNLSYPGGPIIDKLAQQSDPADIKFPIAKMSDNSLDFSFSGLKTSFYYFVKKENLFNKLKEDQKLLGSLLASFQKAAISIIEDRLTKAIQLYKPKSLIISGGVACNSLLREKAKALSEKFKINLYIPSPKFCTDNAAMIAVVGYKKYKLGLFSSFSVDAQSIYYDY